MNQLMRLALLLVSLVAMNIWANDATSPKSTDSAQLSIQIKGVQNELADNVNKRLQAEFNRLPEHSDKTVKQWYASSAGLVKQALKPYGYFKASVKRQGIKHQDKTWQVTYRVNKGEPLQITQLNVQVVGPGKDNAAIQKVLSHIPVRKGERFQVEHYSDAKHRLLSAAQHQGYIKAKVVKDSINIDLDKYTCEINITIDTNKQYYFGEVEFTDNPIDDSVLARYVDFKQGEPFNSKTLMNLQDSLGGSGYFQAVQVDPEIDQSSEDEQVPVKVHLHSNKKRRYQFGIGYGSVSGARAKASTDWRWVNRYGHKLNASLTLSQINRNIETRYSIPGAHPSQDEYIIHGGLYTLHPEGGRSKLIKLGAKYQSQYGKWRYHYGANYSFERFKTDIHPSYQQTHILVPNIGVGWMSPRQPMKIDRGARFHVMLRGTGGPLSSKVNFLQTKTEAKVLETLWHKNRFILGGQLGYTWINDVGELPLSYQFYAGGPDSVRGYEPQSIGPGRFLGEFSAEYQRQVYGNWFGAIFYDAGTAVEQFNQIDNKLKRSVGLGVVWQSPVGNIEAYLAHPVNDDRAVSFIVDLGPQL